MHADQQLSKSLKPRHLSMIAIAGVIGAGLFVGSGAAIQQAGPGILVAYLAAGLVVILVMRMLGEMAAANPETGSFSTYADKALGRWAGFSIGWLYAWFWIIVLGIEATAGAAIMHRWVPGVDQWIWALVLMVLLTLTNLGSVKSYGEFEFWFASIKVAAIVIFLLAGIAAILGLMPGVSAPGVANLLDQGGFMPNGPGAVLAGILVVVFSFFGAEIATIAAGESENPVDAVKKAVKSTVWRILIFYIGSIFVIVSVLPWDDAAVQSGPFAAVLGALKLPGVDLAMSIIVVVALLSAMNANIYGASRMAFSLGERGMAPRVVRSITRNGVPWAAVSGSVLFSFVTVGLNWAWPDAVLPALLNVVGSTLLIVWTSIVVSQIVLRRRADCEGLELPIRFWGFPWLSYTTLGLLLAVMVLVMFDTAARTQLLLTFGLTALLAIIAAATQRGGRGVEPAA